jgi:perosamine synthetase
MIQARVPRFQFFYGLEGILRALASFPFQQQKVQKEQLHSQEEKLAALFSRTHAILTSSYRIGLLDTLEALHLPKGSEVILGPITIADTINSIRMAGLVPVLCDLDKNTQAPSISNIAQCLSPKTKVVLITYLSGIVPNIDELVEFSKKNDLLMIEDFSQAMGANYQDRPVGWHGDISIASLSIGKNLSTFAGGLILFNNPILLPELRMKQENRSSYSLVVLWYLLKACLKVEIATNKLIFSYFTFPLLRIIACFQKTCPPRFVHDPPTSANIFCSSNVFKKTHYPISFYRSPTRWQIRILERQQTHYHQDLALRKKNALLFLANLTPLALRRFPAAINSVNNSFYHLPFYGNGRTQELRAYLFQNGIDTGGYGLNLCSEEKELGVLNNELDGARSIKHDCTFIPINEHSTAAEIKLIADLLNNYCTDQ